MRRRLENVAMILVSIILVAIAWFVSGQFRSAFVHSQGLECQGQAEVMICFDGEEGLAIKCDLVESQLVLCSGQCLGESSIAQAMAQLPMVALAIEQSD